MTERDIAPEPDADSAATAFEVPDVRALTGSSPIRVVRQSPHRTAALRQELAEKAAATDELRVALDQLRQVLDIDNAPPQPGAARRRHRFAVLGVGVLVLIGLVAYLVLDRRLDDAARSTSALPGASAPASAASDAGATAPGSAGGTVPSGVTTAPSPAASLRPLPWPGGAVLVPPGQVATGPGADAPGTDVQVALDDDGVHLDVVERLVLADATGDPLVLATPSLVGFAATTVSDLQVQLDDTVTDVVTDGAVRRTAATGTTYRRAVVRYRLGGAVVKVTPAAPGRAFGLVTPLTATLSQANGADVVVRVLDRRVLGVSCPAVQGTGAVCGTRTADGWTATVPGAARPVVLLQLTR